MKETSQTCYGSKPSQTQNLSFLGRITGKYSEDFESVAVESSDSASDQVKISVHTCTTVHKYLTKCPLSFFLSVNDMFFLVTNFFMFLAHQVKYLVTLDPWLQTGHTDLKIKRSLGFQCHKYYETGHN